MICGFDTSLSVVAGAAIGYDETLRTLKGPVFISKRWGRGYHYFDRLRESARSHEWILDLQALMNISLGVEEVFITQEEPWPLGMVGGKMSSALKQQAEISGAFLGGLVRYGFTNVAQMNSVRWRQMIADDLGITIHHSKWKDPALCAVYDCKPEDTGKFRSKQWAVELFGEIIPDWPDIIASKDGNVPKPESSRAKPFQPDDRYDALAIMWTWAEELSKGPLQAEIQEAVKPRQTTKNDKLARVKKALQIS